MHLFRLNNNDFQVLQYRADGQLSWMDKYYNYEPFQDSHLNTGGLFTANDFNDLRENRRYAGTVNFNDLLEFNLGSIKEKEDDLVLGCKHPHPSFE